MRKLLIIYLFIFLFFFVLAGCVKGSYKDEVDVWNQSSCAGQYLEDEKYCEKDSDCIWALGCCRYVPANKCHYYAGGISCEAYCPKFPGGTPKPKGEFLRCIENRCLSSSEL